MAVIKEIFKISTLILFNYRGTRTSQLSIQNFQAIFSNAGRGKRWSHQISPVLNQVYCYQLLSLFEADARAPSVMRGYRVELSMPRFSMTIWWLLRLRHKGWSGKTPISTASIVPTIAPHLCSAYKEASVITGRTFNPECC